MFHRLLDYLINSFSGWSHSLLSLLYYLNHTTSRVLLQRLLYTLPFRHPKPTFSQLIQPGENSGFLRFWWDKNLLRARTNLKTLMNLGKADEFGKIWANLKKFISYSKFSKSRIRCFPLDKTRTHERRIDEEIEIGIPNRQDRLEVRIRSTQSITRFFLDSQSATTLLSKRSGRESIEVDRRTNARL